MTKPLANKWVRKAVYNAINNIIVDGNTIPCNVSKVTANGGSSFYTLLTTQTNVEENPTKCEGIWLSSILIDVVTIYSAAGNPANRSFCDDITQSVITETNNLTLDVSSGLRIHRQNIGSISNLDNETDTQNVFRNLIRLELYIY